MDPATETCPSASLKSTRSTVVSGPNARVNGCSRLTVSLRYFACSALTTSWRRGRSKSCGRGNLSRVAGSVAWLPVEPDVQGVGSTIDLSFRVAGKLRNGKTGRSHCKGERGHVERLTDPAADRGIADSDIGKGEFARPCLDGGGGLIIRNREIGVRFDVAHGHIGVADGLRPRRNVRRGFAIAQAENDIGLNVTLDRFADQGCDVIQPRQTQRCVARDVAILRYRDVGVRIKGFPGPTLDSDLQAVLNAQQFAVKRKRRVVEPALRAEIAALRPWKTDRVEGNIDLLARNPRRSDIADGARVKTCRLQRSAQATLRAQIADKTCGDERKIIEPKGPIYADVVLPQAARQLGVRRCALQPRIRDRDVGAIDGGVQHHASVGADEARQRPFTACRTDRAGRGDTKCVAHLIDCRRERRAAVEIDIAAIREWRKPGHGDGRLCVLRVAGCSSGFDIQQRMRQRDRKGTCGRPDFDRAARRDGRAREHVGLRARQTKTSK